MDEEKVTSDQMIAIVINSKYSISDQIALLRQKDSKPEEWQDFYNFAERVKADVRAEYGETVAAIETTAEAEETAEEATEETEEAGVEETI